MTEVALALVGCAIWIYLLAARGGFWRAAEHDDATAMRGEPDTAWPSVAAIVPARDEAAVIGESLRSLLRQDYRGTFEVIVVDDHSSDETAAIAYKTAADAARPLSVVAAASLPARWTGKLWALHCGIQHAQRLAAPPAYLLLTDADIRHPDDSLTKLVRRAMGGRLVLTSLMARLRCVSFAEKTLIPAFVFFFQMIYPFAWVNRGDRTTAAAAGGCMLVEREALLAAGGIEAIRGELIDDCALAQLLKGRGGAIWLGLATRATSTRAYATVGPIRRMVARSAYAQLEHSPWWLLGATVAMIATFIGPPLLAMFAHGPAQLLGALTWALMALAFQPTLRFYGLSPLWGLALPAIAGAYLAFTWDSACQHFRGKGGAWKGRVYRQAAEREITKRGG